jgi:LysR family glycine cleavage system transcriptional activator
MTAAAAANGLGLALVPRLLIEPELVRGELVVACDLPLKGERAYYLVTSERSEDRPVVKTFLDWLSTTLALPRQA